MVQVPFLYGKFEKIYLLHDSIFDVRNRSGIRQNIFAVHSGKRDGPAAEQRSAIVGQGWAWQKSIRPDILGQVPVRDNSGR